MLARLGVAVSLFYRARLPLRGFDEDLRTARRGRAAGRRRDAAPRSAPRECSAPAASGC